MISHRFSLNSFSCFLPNYRVSHSFVIGKMINIDKKRPEKHPLMGKKPIIFIKKQQLKYNDNKHKYTVH